MENFVYENKYSLPHSLCNEIIELFKKNTNSHIQGVTLLGFNKNVKDTTDFIIP